MRGFILSLLIVLLMIVAAGVGLFGQLPGLTLVGMCAGPFAFTAMGFALGRMTHGRRLRWESTDAPPTRRTAPVRPI